ncbi:AraC family transcriptional regulator [Actinoallomurus bryophytorum]|uniref:AraC-like DNA-binding protein n=1 Tax=Actinoallomurus bryophytorum TaxID=1490222 RepID=A0A543CHB7_9ACTN|nr:AraC family transcriptional regulator [Actinoallomurus bryophytorum]TQL96492.1 AraC-like DNA-binding protein [Actinoallomurus bryophytorum]
MISEVIGTIHAGSAHARRITESGAWGARYPAFVGVGFHVVLGGSGWLITRDGETTALRAGDIVLAPYGSEHGLSHAPGALATLPVAPMGAEPPSRGPYDFDFLCGCYRVDHGQIHRFLRELPDVVAISPDYERHPELRALTDLLGDDVSQARPGAGATRPALVDLILVHALRQWQEQSGDEAWPTITDPGVAAALRAIHGGLDEQWTVRRLSEIAGMSRTTFTRRFTALVGKPPMTYLIGRRLMYGAGLLRATPVPLATIARQVGYSSGFAFASAFRREYGVSPGRFRQDMRSARYA